MHHGRNKPLSGQVLRLDQELEEALGGVPEQAQGRAE